MAEKISDRLTYLRKSFYENTGITPNMVILGEEIRFQLYREIKPNLLYSSDSQDESYEGMRVVRSQQEPHKIEVGRFSTESEYK